MEPVGNITVYVVPRKHFFKIFYNINTVFFYNIDTIFLNEIVIIILNIFSNGPRTEETFLRDFQKFWSRCFRITRKSWRNVSLLILVSWSWIYHDRILKNLIQKHTIVIFFIVTKGDTISRFIVNSMSSWCKCKT